MSHLNSTKKVSDDETINVFIVGHTHDDPGWLVTTDEYYVKQVRYILDTVVAALKANKQRKYTYTPFRDNHSLVMSSNPSSRDGGMNNPSPSATTSASSSRREEYVPPTHAPFLARTQPRRLGHGR